MQKSPKNTFFIEKKNKIVKISTGEESLYTEEECDILDYILYIKGFDNETYFAA